LFPRVRVEPDRIYVRDGRIATSAGITAGMDLALALLEDDLGGELARDVARQPGAVPAPTRRSVAVQRALDAPLAEPPDAARAADLDPRTPRGGPGRRGARAAHGMSPRNFARIFTRELAGDPGALCRARARGGGAPLARGLVRGPRRGRVGCGFGSAETLRRAFQRLLRVSPSCISRRRFARDAIRKEKRA
jgi:transcriptional regulator GlxA family with amidase domain